MSRHDGHDGRFREPAKKGLGQHFLRDAGVVDRIILALGPRPGDRLVEIGPGQGAMTFPLLDRHGSLTAIEFDRDLGKMSDEDATEMMRFYRARAIEVIKELAGSPDADLSVQERIEREIARISNFRGGVRFLGHAGM